MVQDLESMPNDTATSAKATPTSRGMRLVVAVIAVATSLMACALLFLVFGDRDAPSPSAPVRFLEPPIPGIMPGRERPKLILAQDITYPPFAFLGGSDTDFALSGFGHDFAHGMKEVCDIDVFIVQTSFDNCWDGKKIGRALSAGEFHACMTFTHLRGARNRFLEFSDPILDLNKPAGLLTRLVDGVPVVNGLSDLAGKKIAEVTGWAPTPDTLALSTNKCTGQPFEDYEIISPEVPEGANANDVSMVLLLNGEVDALWIYADQAYLYQCPGDVSPDWNCSLWEGFGSKYAYVQTGMITYAVGGTTLTMSKKGSGIPDIVNPCIQKFKETKSYFDICQKHDLVGSCFPNSHFSYVPKPSVWEIQAPQLNTTCSDGYCSCPEA